MEWVDPGATRKQKKVVLSNQHPVAHQSKLEKDIEGNVENSEVKEIECKEEMQVNEKMWSRKKGEIRKF